MDVNLLSEKDFFDKAELKLKEYFSLLIEENTNKLTVIDQIIRTSAFSERLAYNQYYQATELLQKTVKKNQEQVTRFVSSVEQIDLENSDLVLRKAGQEIKIPLKSAEEILNTIIPKAFGKTGYYNQLAFILRNENYLFLQMLLALKENKKNAFL